MGQKVHPYGFRLGFNKPWRSRWFAKHGYAKLLQEDLELRENLRERAEIGRASARSKWTVPATSCGSPSGLAAGHHHRPQGRGDRETQAGHGKKTKREVFIDIQEVHKPELDAQLVSEIHRLQLEKRVAFRRAMRKAVDSALRFGCKGIKVRVSGRLNGAEIARSEWYLQGQLPLHTLRADIDYGFAEAHTTYGVIGIKTWIYKGEILDLTKRRGLLPEPEPRREMRDRRDRGDRPGATTIAPPRRRPRRSPLRPPRLAAPPYRRHRRTAASRGAARYAHPAAADVAAGAGVETGGPAGSPAGNPAAARGEAGRHRQAGTFRREPVRIEEEPP